MTTEMIPFAFLFVGFSIIGRQSGGGVFISHIVSEALLNELVKSFCSLI